MAAAFIKRRFAPYALSGYPNILVEFSISAKGGFLEFPSNDNLN
jgi:hypothetical protein